MYINALLNLHKDGLMDLLFNVIIILTLFTFILFIMTLIIAKRRKKKISKQIKNLSKESKLMALDELRRIIKKDPYNFLARDKLADLLIQKRSYLAAIKEYLIILDHSQSNEKIDEAKYLGKIGKAYILLDNLKDAKKYLLMAKQKDDINFDINKNLADIELLQGNYDKAEIYLNLVLQLEPENLELIKKAGICYYKLKKFKSAFENLTKVVKSDKDDIECIFYIATSFYNVGKYEEALKFFTRLKKEAEYSAESFYMIGNMHYKQKLYVQAIEDYSNALATGNIKSNDQLAEIHYIMADCYSKTHNLPRALEHWRTVTEFDNNYKDVLEKIETFTEISSNHLLEMYLIGSINQFTRICKIFIKYYLQTHSTLKGNVKFIETKTNADGSMEIMTEVTSSNYLEQNFFVFIRSATTIGDMAMRNLYNRLKEQKADKGICITAGAFSDSAKEFVESRMLKLVERNQLIDILGKISKYLQKQN